MTSRQVVRVFSAENPNTTTGEVTIPDVFRAPVRNDIVQTVFSNLNKNRQQAHGVDKEAGMMYNAESWGTGRAVARIPRVGGSGTSRSGQGAFGNMCRGGRMFNPKATWRRWHRKVNLTLRRHAVASAVAATAIPSLVMARGHRVNQCAEIPLVVDRLNFDKTTKLIEVLNRLGLSEELEKVKNSRKVRVGSGKQRNRRYVQRRGPLIVYDNETALVKQASSNIPGVDICHIDRLNLLELAPGGHLGRLVIWTKKAFEQLTALFGTLTSPSELKRGYTLERPLLSNANLARIVNSDEVQSVVRQKRINKVLHDVHKRNPLTNKSIMSKLNPHDKVRKAAESKKAITAKNGVAAKLKARRAVRKTYRKQGKAFIRSYRTGLEGANQDTMADYRQYIKDTTVGKDVLKQ